MKKYVFLMISFVFSGIIFWSCSDDNSSNPVNQSPTCNITSPISNSIIDENAIINVTVSAQDNDGTIDNIYFFLNSALIDSSSVTPYSADIPTQGIELGGNHFIIVYSKDNDGAISIPDSITFSTRPKAPTNLVITQTDITSANLTWNDNSLGEDNFMLERKLQTDSVYQIIANINGSDLPNSTYYDNNLTPSSMYNYRLSALKGEYNSTFLLKSYENIFPPPSNLTIVQNNVYTFALNWTDNSEGEDGFKIERKIDNGDYVEIGSTTLNLFTDNTVTKQGYETIYYQVRAYKGTEYFSAYTTSNSSVSFPPPTNLTFTKETLSTIRLNWTDNSTGEEGFKIDKKVGVNDWILGFSSVTENTETWTDTNAEINEAIEYRVYGFKGLNLTETISSSEIDNTFPAPTELVVLQTSVTSANLEWTDNSVGEEKFDIERKLSTETTFQKIGEVTGSDTTNKTWSDSNLIPNEFYNYRITAVHGVNSSQYTLTDYFNEFFAPSELNTFQNSLTSVTITWSDNNIGEDKFEIERKLETDTEFIKVGEVTSNDSLTNFFIDTNLEPCSIYNYRIKALLGEFVSNNSYINYDNVIPAPSNVTLSRISTTNSIIRITWEDKIIGEEGFIIERKDSNNDTWTYLITVNQNEEMWIDSTSISGVTNYRLCTQYQLFQSEYSNEATIEIIPNKMIKVFSGIFSMGSLIGQANEEPVHSVEITKDFYLGKYEVTQDEWINIMGSNPSTDYGVGATFPVYNVNWYSVIKYCNLRSNAENLTPCYSINGTTDTNLWGDIPSAINADWDSVICDFSVNGYRLPTEAEWEYSARYNDGRNYPWGEYWPNIGICNFNNAMGHATAVGFYPDGNSQLDFCDMAGNLDEWVWDWYGEYLETPQTDPTGPSSIQSYRVYRGGMWGDGRDQVRSAYRISYPPNLLSYVIGFRVARTK